jgi:hypothetical protein
LVSAPNASEAQSTCTDQNCPADFIELESPNIQAGKTSFKFQSRISQAKLPLADGRLNVIVHLREGTTTWCSQTLTGVQVRDSVLNLEVGPDTGMNCTLPLEEVIASRSSLGFQICINNEENCLKPIALSSVPYAVKADFARRAQQSHEADVAAQCHYAHRVAADLDLFESAVLGSGYYDFHTPLLPSTDITTGLAANAVTNREGVIQWTPVGASERKLNVCAKVEGEGNAPSTLASLDELKLHAALTQAYGDLTVSGHANVNSLAVFEQSTFGGTAMFQGPAVQVGAGTETTFTGPVNFLGSVNLQADVGVAITSAQIVDGQVMTVDLSDGAVTSAKLAQGAVTSDKVGPGAVGESALADGAVTTTKLAPGSVDSLHLQDAAITSSKMGGDAVASSNIVNLTILNEDIANSTITGAKLDSLTITGSKIANATITGTKLATNTVGTSRLSGGYVPMGTGATWPSRWLTVGRLCVLEEMKCDSASAQCSCGWTTQTRNNGTERLYESRNAFCNLYCFGS